MFRVIVSAVAACVLSVTAMQAQQRGWFVLIDVNGTRNQMGDGPKQFGPYASKEMCRIAANSIVPREEMFWTRSARTEAAARREREYTEYRSRQGAAILLAMAKKGYRPGQKLQLPNGDELTVSRDGVEHWLIQGMSSSGWGYSEMCPCYRALTACEYLPKP